MPDFLLRLFIPILLLTWSALPQAQEVHVESERVTEHNGMLSVCGTGAGMAPCRDRNGETYAEEIRGPDIHAESSDELAEQAERLRNESPEELERTITEMEQGSRPY